MKQKKWDSYGDTEFFWNGSAFENRAQSGQTYSKNVVQNYLAGAYYKIEEGKNIELDKDFPGFGNVDNNEEAAFRGVIVGTGEKLTLTGNNPLIVLSNGSVVKDINIVVNTENDIVLTQSTIMDSKNVYYKYDYRVGKNEKLKAYGAVMGKVLGGDNIIDNVSVSFGDSNIKLTGDYAQIIPVGGYVGVVTKGSLIFRDMEQYRSTDESEYNTFIGYDITKSNTDQARETIRTGGLIGQIKTVSSDMIASTGADHIDHNAIVEKCKVYNVDIFGHEVGGIVGACEQQDTYLGVFDTVVVSDKTTKSKIKGHSLNNATSGTRKYRGAGGILGCSQNMYNRFTVENCLVEGYTIESYRDAGGVVGSLDCISETKDNYDGKICNVKVKNVKLVSNERCGALVGYLYKNLSGYNIITDSVQYKTYTDGSTLANYGNIVGYSNSTGKNIKIAGFSRKFANANNVSTGFVQREQMVGNIGDAAAGSNNKPYGNDGYVIFADYNNVITNTDSSVANNSSPSNSTGYSNVAVNTYDIESGANSNNNYPNATVNPKRIG